MADFYFFPTDEQISMKTGEKIAIDLVFR